MADARRLTPKSPLDGWAERFASTAPGIVLSEMPFMTMVNLRVMPGSAAAVAVETALGVMLPRDPTRVEVSGGTDDLTVVWLAPDEFLLICGTRTADAVIDMLRSALGGSTRGAAVDVSAQRTAIALSGPEARDLLAGGCSTDLAAEVAPTGTSVQTLLAQTGVIILVSDAEAGAFLLVVRASFADYLAAWLTSAA